MDEVFKGLEFTGGATMQDNVSHIIIKSYSGRPPKHDDFVTGGNSKFMIRSKIMDWRLFKKYAKKDPQKMIELVNSLLETPYKITDEKKLCALISEMSSLPKDDLISALEYNLNLREALVVALKRLYYIWSDVNQLDKKQFCDEDPIECILNLLEYPTLNNSKKEITDLYHFIENISEQIDDINSPIPDIIKTINESDSLEQCMDKFMQIYIDLYPVLEQREKYYINIAQKIEEVSDRIQLILF